MALYITNNNNISNFDSRFHVLLKSEIKKTVNTYGTIKKLLSDLIERDKFEGNFQESLAFNTSNDYLGSGIGDKKDLSQKRFSNRFFYYIFNSKF